MPLPATTPERLARHLEAGDRLFEEGDPGDSMYVVQSGRIRLFRRVGAIEVTIASLGPGELLGEMAVLEGLPRTACAVAEGPTLALELDRSLFEQMVRTNGEIALRMLRKLSSRLREADRQIGAFLTSSGAVRSLELVRGLARGAPDRRRELPAEFGAAYLATLAGVSLDEAREIEQRLRRAEIVGGEPPRCWLAPDETIEDYLCYLDLGQRYDPVPVTELAGVIGLPEDEVHRVVQRLLEARLAEGGQGAQLLADSYRQYLRLKQRFEYPSGEGNADDVRNSAPPRTDP
ncbi:MAG: Crp/Fnr family transcriptional regulator [Deltaproteobacteria bacterium]